MTPPPPHHKMKGKEIRDRSEKETETALECTFSFSTLILPGGEREKKKVRNIVSER